MQKKLCLRYHRFSDKKQSNGSIERQSISTSAWCKNNQVETVATFNDDGYSARTFDRPDVKKLFEFITTQSNKIEYLVVAELTRFSRDAGEAIKMVKELQRLFNIRIVSAERNQVYDVNESSSFVMMSLEFTLGDADNIQRTNNINGGIYAAKTNGRFIGSHAPYGFEKSGYDKNRHLVPVPAEIAIVQQIFADYTSGLSLCTVEANARAAGYHLRGNSIIQKLLANPIYIGYQQVRGWKHNPGGLFPVANLPKTVSNYTFQLAQEMLSGKKRRGVSISEELPLRGVIRCPECSHLLTGAPSRSKSGRYYYYYKCPHTTHINLSALKVHAMVEDILAELTIPSHVMGAIQDRCLAALKSGKVATKAQLEALQEELAMIEADLVSLEQKWIRDKINYSTYQRWSLDLTARRESLTGQIAKLYSDRDTTDEEVLSRIALLCQLPELYAAADIVGKQQILNLVFEQYLTFSGGIVRTHSLMEVFAYNEYKFNNLNLLFIEEKRGNEAFPLQVDFRGASSNSVAKLLQVLSSIKAA